MEGMLVATSIGRRGLRAATLLRYARRAASRLRNTYCGNALREERYGASVVRQRTR